ncbi:MAG: guanitoxin biosynthesis MATE family efflux transporter GntT [Rhizonema sp. NSF051]|nr:guanitoxin biosynthesis MATE family efflux transporter GntT [Rhizonema sp. NSF051]
MSLTLSSRYDFLGRFLRQAITNILSSIMVPLAGAISVAFLGHLEDISYLAGMTLAITLFDYIYWVLNFLRMATTGMTAEALGRSDREQMLLVGLRNSLTAAGIGILLLILQYPLRELGFTLLSAPPDVRASAIAYFDIRIWGFPAALLNMILVGWLLGQEQNKKVLLVSIFGNSANIVLNYLFIVRCNWGSRGAGLSQALSDSLMLIVILILVLKEIPFKEIQFVAKRIWDWSTIKANMTLNGDLFIRYLCVMSCFTIFTSLSAEMGTNVLSENALLLQIVLLHAFCCDGLGLATETLAGNFKGKKTPEQLLPLLQIAVGTGVSVALTFSGVSILFPKTVFGLLTNHTQLIAETQIYVPWLLGFLVFTIFSFLLDGLFAALAQGHIIRNAALIAITLGFTPLAVLAWYFHSNHILWLAMSVFMAVRALSLVIHVPKILESNVATCGRRETSA